MMRWNLQSNAGDVLSLGPRTAGRLATVGIRSVAELLAAKPQAIGQRLPGESLSAEVVSAWQREARLMLELPQLPAMAARFFAAIRINSPERLRQTMPTELLSLLETARQNTPETWLAQTDLPTIAELTEWIQLARQTEKTFAA